MTRNYLLLSRRFRSSSRANYIPTPSQNYQLTCIRQKVQSNIYQLKEYPCEACGSNDYQILGKKDRNGLPCSTAICRDCGLLMTNPRFRSQDYADFYSNHFRKLKGKLPTRGQSGFRSEGNRPYQYKFLCDHLNLQSPAKILDIGCGAGELLYRLAEDGHNCIGIDYDEDNLSIGKQMGLNLISISIEELDEQEFDLVIMSHSLEHVVEPPKMLQTITQKLNSSGILFIEVPNIWSFLVPPYRDLMHMIQFVHIFSFTPLSLKNLMARAGFEQRVMEEKGFTNQPKARGKDRAGRVILGLYEFTGVKGPAVTGEYPLILRELQKRERRRWLNTKYCLRKLLFYSYPLRSKLGLTDIRGKLKMFSFSRLR